MKMFSRFFFYIVAQNKDIRYIIEPVLTSTHNLYFGAKIRKIGLTMHGVQGVYITRTGFLVFTMILTCMSVKVQIALKGIFCRRINVRILTI